MMDLKQQVHNLKKLIRSLQDELDIAESKLQWAKAPPQTEAVLPAHLVNHHVILHRATQVKLSMPCYGTKIQVGTRMALLQPINEFDREIPEPKFYPGTVTDISGNPNDPTMKFTYDGGPGGTQWIMCGVKQYQSYCIPIPPMYEQNYKEIS